MYLVLVVSFPSSAVEDTGNIIIEQPLDLECTTSSANIRNERSRLTGEIEGIHGTAINLKKYVKKTKDGFDTSNDFSFLVQWKIK